MNKKIIISLSVIAAVAAIVIGGTVAFFSDTETSTGNIFTAGSLDLQVDNTCHYNDNVCQLVSDSYEWVGDSPYPVPRTPCDCTWELRDLTSEKFFNLDDVKPGDEGESTISLHVYDNDAWGCVTITPTANHDNGLTGPESKVDSTDGDWEGELAQNMQFMIWADICDGRITDPNPQYLNALPGDNIYQAECDRLLTQGTGPLAPVTWALADSITSNVFTGAIGPLVGENTYYIGVSWNIPTTVGNIIQSDSYAADISFYTEQHRNNPSFQCSDARTKTLLLENKDAGWKVIPDNTQGFLTYNTAGENFDYTFQATGLTGGISYSLIYYADFADRYNVWGGNNPGAHIATFATDASGNIALTAGSIDLGIDLPESPDWNGTAAADYCVTDGYSTCQGAKIWLVPTSDLSGGSSLPLVSWNPSTYLFETDLINYNDTNN